MRQYARRIVTGHLPDGRSTISFNDEAPNMTEIKGWPGLWVSEIWITDESPVDNRAKVVNQDGQRLLGCVKCRVRNSDVDVAAMTIRKLSLP